MTASKSHTPSTYALEELNRESTYGGAGIEVSNRKIPVISLSDFDNRRDEITDQLWRAATEIGFFQLKDHGISKQMIQTAFHQAERFFNLDDQQKAKYPRPKGVNAGWESRSQVRPSTGTKDDKESYQITRYHMEGLWPDDEVLADFQDITLAFEKECWHLGMKVLSCFADKLGFHQEFFTQAHDPQKPDYQSTLRLLHYFPTEAVESQGNIWRAGAHTDFDCLTLLYQHEGHGGLQVCPGHEADSQEWTSIPPIADVITCNIGDMLMRWSDDQLKSNLHRVRLPRKGEYCGSRHSIAFFCQANKSQIIQGPRKQYPAISAEDFLNQRIQANFAN